MPLKAAAESTGNSSVRSQLCCVPLCTHAQVSASQGPGLLAHKIKFLGPLAEVQSTLEFNILQEIGDKHFQGQCFMVCVIIVALLAFGKQQWPMSQPGM